MAITVPATLLHTAAEHLRRLDVAGVARCYRADAILDANVPYWRYQLQGGDAIRAAYAEELANVTDPVVTSSRVTEMNGGLVVEVEVRFGSDSEQHLWRELHLLEGDAAGIARHTTYCTGIWDSAAIRRQAVESPMVEPWNRA